MNLIHRLQAGEPRAWDEVVENHYPRVYGRFRNRGVPETEISDLVQEVFVAAFQSLGNFKSGFNGGGIGGWIQGIAGHKLSDHFRNNGRQNRGVGGTDAQEILQQIADPVIEGESSVGACANGCDFSARVHRALEHVRAEFEDNSWNAFWKTTIVGLPAGQVADEMGMSRNAVYLARSRILCRLREEISQQNGEGRR